MWNKEHPTSLLPTLPRNAWRLINLLIKVGFGHWEDIAWWALKQSIA